MSPIANDAETRECNSTLIPQAGCYSQSERYASRHIGTPTGRARVSRCAFLARSCRRFGVKAVDHDFYKLIYTCTPGGEFGEAAVLSKES